MIDLTNRKILVTGASSGIGKAVAILLNKLGAFVVLSGRDEVKLTNVKTELSNVDRVELLPLDLTTFSSVKVELKKSVAASGKFSGFVHCAGLDITKPFKLLKKVDFELLYQLNVVAPFELSRELVHKSFFEPEGGCLLWMSSVMAHLGQKGKIAYTANKAAIEGLVKSYALELAPKKIRVNSIAPGIVKTPLTTALFAKISQESVDQIEAMHPLGFGKPDDVAHLVAFLVSPQARWITGSTHFIDGGYHIQ